MRTVLPVLALAIALAGPAPAAPAPAAPPSAPPGPRVVSRERQGAVEILSVASPAIAGALEHQPGVALQVLLPPSYAGSPGRRYPVVYFLPGFGGSPSLIAAWREPLAAAFAAKAGGPEPEFILVAIEGRSAMGGSFYVNGPVDGAWEDWVVREAVALVDRTYRTIPRREARGLAGFSMGGFGALNLGLSHPDVYACVFATGPGVLAPGHLRDAFDTWDATFREAYGRAFDPDPANEDARCRIPAFDGSPGDAGVVARWERGFDGWPARLDAYQAARRPLAAVRLEVGTDDVYPWIVEGTRWLARTAGERGLGWEFAEFEGGHEVQPGRVRSSLAPFFQRCLEPR